jgi:hypothetical protein
MVKISKSLLCLSSITPIFAQWNTGPSCIGEEWAANCSNPDHRQFCDSDGSNLADGLPRSICAPITLLPFLINAKDYCGRCSPDEDLITGVNYPSQTPSNTPNDAVYPTSLPISNLSELLSTSGFPSLEPSYGPPQFPSSKPSGSSFPSSSPTNDPTEVLWTEPSGSTLPSMVPSYIPSSDPSQPLSTSLKASSIPSQYPSDIPSSNSLNKLSDSLYPSQIPSNLPSSFSLAATTPSGSSFPSMEPSTDPSTPYGEPSGSSLPSGEPSEIPSSEPISTADIAKLGASRYLRKK